MEPAKLSSLNQVVGNFLSVILGLIGVASLVMIVVGGFNLLSAGSDKEGTTKAKNTITFAVIGLTLAISSWMIIKIFGSFFGITGIDQFNICLPGQNC